MQLMLAAQRLFTAVQMLRNTDACGEAKALRETEEYGELCEAWVAARDAGFKALPHPVIP